MWGMHNYSTKQVQPSNGYASLCLYKAHLSKQLQRALQVQRVPTLVGIWHHSGLDIWDYQVKLKAIVVRVLSQQV